MFGLYIVVKGLFVGTFLLVGLTWKLLVLLWRLTVMAVVGTIWLFNETVRIWKVVGANHASARNS